MFSASLACAEEDVLDAGIGELRATCEQSNAAAMWAHTGFRVEAWEEMRLVQEEGREVLGSKRSGL